MTTDESTINVRAAGWGKTNAPLTYNRDPAKRRPRCQGATVNGSWSGQCSLAGTYLETQGGIEYYWCGTHAPSTVAARREKRLAKDNAQWRNHMASREHAAVLATARVELFDALQSPALRGHEGLAQRDAVANVVATFDAYIEAGGSRDGSQ